MADAIVNVPGLPSASTKAIDSSSLSVNAAQVLRQRINISDPTNPSAHAVVSSGGLVGNEYGLVVRPVGSLSTIPATPTVLSTIKVSVDIQVSGDTVIVPGVAGQTIRLMRGLLTIMSSGGLVGSNQFNVIRFRDTTPQNLSGPLYFFDGGMTLDDSGEPWYVTAVGKGLAINQTLLGQIGGDIWYTQS